MAAHPNDGKNAILAAILARFDRDDKDDLAEELVTGLSLEIDGPSYQRQVAGLLGRQLTPEEYFRLSVLNAAYNDIGGGGGGGEEEEE